MKTGQGPQLQGKGKQDPNTEKKRAAGGRKLYISQLYLRL